MKKPLAMILLVLAGTAWIAFSTAFTYFLFLMTGFILPAGADWIMYAILTLFVYLAGYPVKFFVETYKRKYSVNAGVFLTCLCAVPIAGAVTARIIYKPAPDELPGVNQPDFLIWFALAVILAFSLGVIARTVGTIVAKKVFKL